VSAHCCTLFHSLLKMTDDANFISQAKSAVSYAPGIDDSLDFHFEWEHDFHALYDAVDPVAGKAPDATKARELMREMLTVMDPILKHYASHEEFVKVKSDYWQSGKPWAKRRYKLFHTADGFNHEAAGSGAPYSPKGKLRYEQIAQGIR